MDESIHGVAVGIFAQQKFQTFDEAKRNELTVWAYELLLDLYDNECRYTEEMYSEIGLVEDVKSYLRYNANKALMNIGLDVMFPEEPVHPIVMNGIQSTTSTHDFFSQKGANYALAKVVPITDDTFNF